MNHEGNISCADSSVADPSLLRSLTAEQQVRLTEVLDDYLLKLEQGQKPSRESLALDHPALAEALDLYLDKLDDLHNLVDDQHAFSDLRGKELGDFRLQDEIGRGGMGIVFSAHQRSLKRQVAVKLLPMAAVLEPKFIERFRNEARAAANLEHPNIVPVYAVGEEVGIHFYAMRLIDGCSLDESVIKHKKRESTPPTNSALLQFADVADALHAAHDFGIVHRDIKPSNLLLDNAGKLWVADFGLARFQDERALTGTGEMIGTMRYMSPEQAQGRNELVDHRTDIYSLGATLYEFLTGQPAIPGEEGPGLLRAIGSQTPVRLRKLRPDLPRDLQTVLDKAMSRHRDDRYLTAGEFAADLRRVARNVPVTTKLVSPVVLAGRWTAAHSRLVSAAIVVFAVAGLGLTTGSYMVNKVISAKHDLAQANLRKAHALGEELVVTIQRLAAVPGAEQVRQDIIRKHLQYYQDFAEQNARDPEMQDQLALAYHHTGSLSEELGLLPEAIQSYEKAEKVLAKLVKRQPTQGAYELHRYENLNHLTLAMSKAGLAATAAELLEEPLARLSSAAEDGQLGSDLSIEYANLENSYGLLAQHLDDRFEDALTAFNKSIAIFRRLEQTLPTDTKAANRVQRGLAGALHNLGALKAAEPESHPDEALDLFREALDKQIRLAKTTDNRLQSSIDLVTTYLSIGNLYLHQMQLPNKAAIAFSEAVEIGERLVDISPDVDSYRRDLAVAQNNLGMSRFRDGDHDGAKTSLKTAVHEYRTLLNAHPDHAGLRSSLGIALSNQAIVLEQLGEPSAAEEAYQRAALHLESTLPGHWAALNKVYLNHANLLKNAGREAEAVRIEQRQIALRSQESK